MTVTHCPSCATVLGEPFATLPGVPALCNALWPSADEAAGAVLGDVELCLCHSCGLILNRAFDPEAFAYSPQYENSLHFSGSFRAFAGELARDLVERHGLAGAQVLEIGPGSGDFLTMLIEAGVGRAIGFDPSHDPSRALEGLGDRAEIQVRPYPTEQVVDAGLVVCRHVLEHVTDPRALLAGVAGSVAPGARVPIYIEVPDADYMIERPAIWDVIYEHYTYFSERSLRWLAESVGLEITGAGRCFGDQYLWLEAVATGRTSAPSPVPFPQDVPVEAARRFGEQLETTVNGWDRAVSEALAEGPVVVWGMGSKGVSFLNVVESARNVTGVIDVNPRKRGLFVPGTGHEVEAPEFIKNLSSPAVLLMNPMYGAEVQETLNRMGWEGSLTVV